MTRSQSCPESVLHLFLRSGKIEEAFFGQQVGHTTRNSLAPFVRPTLERDAVCGLIPHQVVKAENARIRADLLARMRRKLAAVPNCG